MLNVKSNGISYSFEGLKYEDYRIKNGSREIFISFRQDKRCGFSTPELTDENIGTLLKYLKDDTLFIAFAIRNKDGKMYDIILED